MTIIATAKQLSIAFVRSYPRHSPQQQCVMVLMEAIQVIGPLWTAQAPRIHVSGPVLEISHSSGGWNLASVAATFLGFRSAAVGFLPSMM